MIKKMCEQDKSFITPLLELMYEEHRAILPDYIPQVNTKVHIENIWNKIFHHKNYFHFVYEKNNQIVAYLGLSKQQTNTDFIFPGEELLILDNIVVHPQFRKQGIATELIIFSKEFAKKNLFQSIDLYVLKPFTNTQKFYQKHDFKFISEYMSCSEF